jgi:retinoid hydroxylase
VDARPPPGRLGAPFLGETLPFLSDPSAFVLARTRQHGDVWKTRILGNTVVFFAGPQAFSFFVDPDNFARRGASPSAFETLLHADAVPFLDGDRHQVRKHLLLRAFTDEALDSYLPGTFTVFERFAQAWVQRGETELGRDLPQLAFDIADYLFAASDPATSETERGADFRRFLDGALAPPINLPFTAYGKAIRARDRLRAFLAARVAERVGDEDGTVIGALRSARGPQEERLNMEELGIELFHFYFAAHAGLAAALAWLLVVLGEHPDLAESVREEADAVLDGGAPRLEQVRRLATARAVSREVLRSYPIAPLTSFGVATRDLELKGYGIRKGWKGAGAIWPTLQDAATFDDPTTFSSDRLDDETLRALPEGAYVPQGAGPHRCAGEALIQVLMPAFLAWFIRNYTWHYPPQDSSPAGRGLGPLPRGRTRGTVTLR